MPPKTKITLSDKELSMVQDSEWILTKQIIIQKVYDLFGENIDMIRSEILNKCSLPENIKLSLPKIYRGENYLQLPYVILDYPRCFDKEDIFAVRTMFWWGNFFSITLHVSGMYKRFVRENLYDHSSQQSEGLFIGVNENQWQHHFEEDNFLPHDQLTVERRKEMYEKNNFIKLAVKFELGKWNNMPSLFKEGYMKIAAVLS